MAKRKLTSFFLYRRRVLTGYVFILAALAVLLGIGLLVPGGLTLAERVSSVRAMGDTLVQINAPYYLLQRASITLLGLSTFSIKLPSLILGALLGVSLFLLLRRWLTFGIAIFGSLIIFSSTTFLAITGSGSPALLYVLYPALLLFFGTRVIAHDRGLVLFTILSLLTIAAALLTPTMVYLVALMIILAIFNPHVRYGIRRLPLTGKIFVGLGFVAALAPITYLIVKQPNVVDRLLAIPNALSLDSVANNIGVLIKLYTSFLHPGITEGMPAPFVGLATAGLAVIGMYRIIRAIYTARAQFIIGWSGFALILAIIDPGFGILLYLPVIILAALGLSQLAAVWYRTFPLNPYARISALLPIGVLIAGIVLGSSMRYINTTLYADGSAELYSKDLQILQNYIATNKPTTVTLAVTDNQAKFYSNYHTTLITSIVNTDEAASATGTIVSSVPLSGKQAPIRILTDGRTEHGDRFYVYR